jgi:tryptophan halogenase
VNEEDVVSTERIERIVIVGGGTAGWLSAAYLNRMLLGGPTGKPEICVVESADIGVIGVGEATIPTLRDTMAALGVDEAEFMRRTSATFKNAIKFKNWLDDPADRPDDYYYHSFGARPAVPNEHALRMAQAWQRQRSAGGKTEPYAYMLGPMPALCDRGRSPKTSESKPYHGHVQYAYHLDAVRLGHFLRELAVERGVRHVVDNVVEVLGDEQGYVRGVRTEAHGVLEGDFFVDCTGFLGLIINQFFGVPFTGYGDSLYCDRAVALQVPWQGGENKINPYTTAAAMGSGWTWEIHLKGRRGMGYVYGSQFISDDAAEAELRRHIGPESEGLEARRLKLRVGRCNQFWTKNCVAIGLSSGFIEPLESTGIYLIEAAVQQLVEYFPDKAFPQPLIDRYNALMTDLYDNTRDFILLHYCLTRRQDTEFWKANKFHPAIPEPLKSNLEIWKFKMPSHLDVRSRVPLFGIRGYLHILAGMDYLPDAERLSIHRQEGYGPNFVARVRARNNEVTEAALKTCPDHTEFLTKLHDRESDAA